MLDWLYVRPEALLFAVAALLYVHDRATPLFANEILFYHTGHRPWRARTARRYPEFARRHLAIARPLRPDTTILRAAWPRSSSAGPESCTGLQAAIEQVEARLRFLRCQSTPLLLTLFVGLPGLYFLYGSAALLIGIAVAYLQALIMAAALLARRKKLGLPWKSVAFAVFESLICIPYAINLYRKMAERLLPADVDPLDLAGVLLDAEESAKLRRDLLQAVEQRISLSEAGETKLERLISYRERVAEESTA